MRIFLCLVFSLLMCISQAYAFGQEGCGAGSCSDCHSLDVNEAEGLFKGSIEKVLRVEFAEMPGVWMVEVENKGERFPLYVDFSKKFVVAGKILRLPEEDKEVKKTKQVTHVDRTRIPLEDALVLGNPMAELRVIVFTDPLCPYCARLHKELEAVVASDPNIAFLIKLNPLDMHGPEAYQIAQAAVCGKSLQALEGGFDLIGLHGQLRQLQKTPAGKGAEIAKLQKEFTDRVQHLTANLCPTPAVDATKALAAELGLLGTPTMILPDGSVLAGVRPAAELSNLIRSKPAVATDSK